MHQDIFYFFNNFAFQNKFVDVLIVFAANWLIWWLVLGVFFLFFLKKITLKNIFQILALALVAWLIAEIIKFFYFSPRPFLELSGVKLLFNHGLNESSPSGHTTLAFALATAIAFITNYKISFIFFTGALLVGLSRIVAGIHWPLDILTGAILGIITIIFFQWLKNKMKRSGLM